VIGYGIGMAATLIGAGYLLLRARSGVTAHIAGRTGEAGLLRLTGALPVLTSALITVGGFAIAVRSIFAI